jgi:hypothetical protein
MSKSHKEQTKIIRDFAQKAGRDIKIGTVNIQNNSSITNFQKFSIKLILYILFGFGFTMFVLGIITSYVIYSLFADNPNALSDLLKIVIQGFLK